MDPRELGKRVAAARAYAGIKSQARLGDILGLSQSTIQRMEAGGRGMKEYERRTLLAAIAEACELPVEWFSADLTRLAEITPASSADQFEQELASAAERTQQQEPPGDETDRARGGSG